MISRIVECGNGGDYEWLRDAHYWTFFIEQRIPGSQRNKTFEICAHATDAMAAEIRFYNDRDFTYFALIAPEYITQHHVDWKKAEYDTES